MVFSTSDVRCNHRRLPERLVPVKRLLPQHIESGALPKKRWSIQGLTILEMLVSTAMLSLIVLGLTAMLIQTQKAFKTGIKASTITDAGRTITDMIAADMRNMSDGQNSNIINLYWSWNENSVQWANNQPFRTNQVDAIYLLEHTNTMWMGVGYAVQNLVPNSSSVVGTLYRYENSVSAPYLLTNYYPHNLFSNFMESVETQSFTNQAYWHRVADGVISLKLMAYDQNGNEPGVEAYYGDWEPKGTFSYPLASNNLPNTVDSQLNTLPNAVDFELAILEPDALTRARALANNPNLTAFNYFMQSNALTTMEIFRRRVSIPVVAR